jgi:hypothetical protein
VGNAREEGGIHAAAVGDEHTAITAQQLAESVKLGL